MITSVTSATVAATSAVVGWGVALGAGGALLVIGLLIALELLGPADSPRKRTTQRLLKVTMIPLLFVFAVSVSARAAAALGV